MIGSVLSRVKFARRLFVFVQPVDRSSSVHCIASNPSSVDRVSVPAELSSGHG